MITIIIDLALIIAGFLLLMFGGDFLVRGSVAISQRLGISALLVSTVVIGFGTSSPELLVAVSAALAGQTDLVLGNVVGSNISNILLILGVATTIGAIDCRHSAMTRDVLAAVFGTLFLVAIAFMGMISLPVGALMLFILIAYLTHSYRLEKRQKNTATHQSETEDYHVDTWGVDFSLMVSGVSIIMLVLGAECLVRGASHLARLVGISDAVIGLSLVAIGTSLPELATVTAAALKRQTDVVIGNILGSTLFNILGVLGVASMISVIPVEGRIANFDIPFSLVVVLALMVLIVVQKRISRLTGCIFVSVYIGYIIWLFV